MGRKTVRLLWASCIIIVLIVCWFVEELGSDGEERLPVSCGRVVDCVDSLLVCRGVRHRRS